VRAVDRAYEAVRSGIIAGRYLAGARLTEQEIATTVGVSRTPVREALRRLDAEGLVEFTPNLGAVVTTWTEEDSDEIFDLRGMLESYGARRATIRATDEQIAELRRLAEQQYHESSVAAVTSNALQGSTASFIAACRKPPPATASAARSPR
jgi:DNA-binding GntR family transcriptional regulator